MTNNDGFGRSGHVSHPLSFWREAIAEYEQSSEGAKYFCKRKGIALSTFQRKRQELMRIFDQNSSPFIPVQISAEEEPETVKEASSAFVLHIGQKMRLEISHDFDASALRRLIPCLC